MDANLANASRLRRNGQRPSCEPCRMSKLACDHGSPVCDRCIKRNVAKKCEYHPAPMTASKEERAARRAKKKAEIAAATNGSSSLTPVSSIEFASPSVNVDIDLDTSPGYLGSTSYLAVFAEGASVSTNQPDSPEESHPLSQALIKSDFGPSTFERMTFSDEALRVLRVFSDVEALDQVWDRVHHQYRHGVFPRETFAEFWRSVKQLYSGIKHFSKDRLKQEMDKLFTNTSRPFKVRSSMTPNDFIKAHVGENMRWDALGLVLSSIGHEARRIPNSDPVWSDPLLKISRNEFSKRMMDLALICMKFCESGSIGVLTLCARFELWLLEGLHFGTNSYQNWARLGDLISLVYALGFHQGASLPEDPRFLREVKKQILAAAYMNDCALSCFLGRPPRMPRKFCNLQMPLDLTFEELFQDYARLDELVDECDANGWAPPRPGRRIVYSRLRLKSTFVREDILELSLMAPPLPANALDIVRDIGQRLRESYHEDVPPHLRYDPTWYRRTNRGITPDITLWFVYLHHVYNQFLLQRVLVGRLKQKPDDLLSVSRRMLSDVLELVNQHDRLETFRAELDIAVVLFGLPSAGVLALELLRQKQAGPLPDFPRSEVIQNISVVVACLGWVASPGDGNYAMCKQAQQLLSRILDQVLSSDFVYVPTSRTDMDILLEGNVNSQVDADFGDWSWFDNLENDGNFWNHLAEHPCLHFENPAP